MSTKPRRSLPPEIQLQRDMLELMGYPAFRRFLFTVAEKSGIAASTYGTDLDASTFEGRRSLGLDILRLADEGMPIRNPERAPFNALAAAIAEVSALQSVTMEESDDQDLSIDDDYERR